MNHNYKSSISVINDRKKIAGDISQETINEANIRLDKYMQDFMINNYQYSYNSINTANTFFCCLSEFIEGGAEVKNLPYNYLNSLLYNMIQDLINNNRFINDQMDPILSFLRAFSFASDADCSQSNIDYPHFVLTIFRMCRETYITLQSMRIIYNLICEKPMTANRLDLKEIYNLSRIAYRIDQDGPGTNVKSPYIYTIPNLSQSHQICYIKTYSLELSLSIVVCSGKTSDVANEIANTNDLSISVSMMLDKTYSSNNFEIYQTQAKIILEQFVYMLKYTTPKVRQRFFTMKTFQHITSLYTQFVEIESLIFECIYLCGATMSFYIIIEDGFTDLKPHSPESALSYLKAWSVLINSALSRKYVAQSQFTKCVNLILKAMPNIIEIVQMMEGVHASEYIKQKTCVETLAALLRIQNRDVILEILNISPDIIGAIFAFLECHEVDYVRNTMLALRNVIDFFEKEQAMIKEKNEIYKAENIAIMEDFLQCYENHDDVSEMVEYILKFMKEMNAQNNCDLKKNYF